jgi:hypothetical protein
VLAHVWYMSPLSAWIFSRFVGSIIIIIIIIIIIFYLLPLLFNPCSAHVCLLPRADLISSEIQLCRVCISRLHAPQTCHRASDLQDPNSDQAPWVLFFYLGRDMNASPRRWWW